MATGSPRQGDTPIRLFKSDFLEAFTHIHPGVVLGVWLPVIGFFLYLSVTTPASGRTAFVPLCVFAGLLLWTLVEYTLHRFVFHFEPRTDRQKRLSYLFHGVHHAQPMCKTRLVMPFAMSIPLGALFYGLLTLVFAVVLGRAAWVSPLFAGLLAGYLLYDMLHYVVHHFRLKSPVLKAIRRSHMQHHGSADHARFGVTSPLWDYVFGTMPADRTRDPAR
jgi:sterol desaturase/sphingolipid hydroxylase (fatty acid hydroxylase superfamily)